MSCLKTVASSIAIVALAAVGTAHAGGKADQSQNQKKAQKKAQKASDKSTRGLAQPAAQGEQDALVVYYEFDSAELQPAGEQKLDEVLTWAQENEDRTIVIAGHSDEVGARDYNVQLARERAQAAADYLEQQGISRDRIEIRSYGEARPASQQDAENRRAVFFATTGGSADQRTMSEREAERQMNQQGMAQQPMNQQRMAQGQGDTYEDTDIYVDDRDVTLEPRQDPTLEPVPPQRSAAVTPTPTYEEPEQDRGFLMTPNGASVSVGGGVTGLIDSNARDFVDEGGSWEARLTYGTRAPLAIEAAYLGTAQDINALGLDEDAVLLGSSAEAAARLNILPNFGVQPYVFGGAGWTHYDLVNEDFNTSNVGDDDNVFYVPVGAGIGFRAFGALVDVRGTVRPVWGDQLLDNETGNSDDGSLDNWGATARLGWEF